MDSKPSEISDGAPVGFTQSVGTYLYILCNVKKTVCNSMTKIGIWPALRESCQLIIAGQGFVHRWTSLDLCTIIFKVSCI